MFIFLALLYLSLVSTRAAPLEIVSGGTTPNNLVLPTYVSPPADQRFVVGILWNSFVTLAIVTWGSVYPNIPAPGGNWWERAWRRIELVFWAVVTPELIYFWGLRQFYGATKIKKKINGECIQCC